MIKFLKRDRWSAYLVGVLIGVLLTFLFVVGQQIGASGGVSRISALIEGAVSSSYTTLFKDSPLFNWSSIFIIGLFLGSYIASKISTKEKIKKDTLWKSSFGSSKPKRYMAAFIGGFLLLFGARLAGGCTSGHAISGGAQLSITSWVFMMAVFATAIPTSFILYRKK